MEMESYKSKFRDFPVVKYRLRGKVVMKPMSKLMIR
jgi:hypothetical protein